MGFGPRSGDDGDKPPVFLVNAPHVGRRAQFGVGDVEEPGPADQAAQRQPILDMQGIVGLITRMGLEVNRHGAIARNRHVVEELFEIRTMILAVAPREVDPFS